MPTIALAVPTSLAPGQVPWPASGSPQSARASGAPAAAELGVRLRAGAKGRLAGQPSPSPLAEIAIAAPGAALAPLVAMSELASCAEPQVEGDASGAWAPPLKESLISVKGIGGVSANVAVRRPLLVLAASLPIKRSGIP